MELNELAHDTTELNDLSTRTARTELDWKGTISTSPINGAYIYTYIYIYRKQAPGSQLPGPSLQGSAEFHLLN